MSVPAVTVAGPVLVTCTSATAATVEVTDDELSPEFGSDVVLLSLAMLVMADPSGWLALRWTTSVNTALLPAGIVPVRVGPEFWTRDTNVVLPGRVSVSWTFWASLGPGLLT